MTNILPVEVINQEPLLVKLDPTSRDGDAPPNTTAEQDRQTAGERELAKTAPPTTTAEQDRKAESQRDINRIWETTQRQIAMWVIGAALVSAVILGLFGKFLTTDNSLQLAANVFLFGVANLVTGFYFGRTNHQRSGGIDGNLAGSRS